MAGVEKLSPRRGESSSSESSSSYSSSSQSSVENPLDAPRGSKVEMTFGIPNFLLIKNDIDPSILQELPEKERAEILASVKVQFEEW